MVESIGLMMVPLFLLTSNGDIPGDITVIKCDRIILNYKYDENEDDNPPKLVYRQLVFGDNTDSKTNPYGWVPRLFILNPKDEVEYDFNKKVYRVTLNKSKSGEGYTIEAPVYYPLHSSFDIEHEVLSIIGKNRADICPLLPPAAKAWFKRMQEREQN